MNSKRIIHIVAGVSLVSGTVISCTVQKYEQPKIPVPQSYSEQQIQVEDFQNIAKISYRDFYKDPVLISLIDKALAGNSDMQVALKQIELASLGYQQSKWGNVPKVSLTIANASINRPSDNSINGISASQFLGKRYTEDYTTAASISWEADIWGKIKSTKEEALAGYLQTQEAAKAVKTRLVSEVVQGYYNLLMLDTQLEITRSNMALSEKTLALIKKQYEVGIGTALAVQQQETNLDQIRKSIPAIESAISTQEHALNILSGSFPSRIERTASLDSVEAPVGLSTGIPSELLSYRPDIKTQELNFRRSVASINIAKASMYPVLNITAQGGLNAFKASDWFKVPGSLFGTVAGALVQPLLQGKQLKTQYEQSKITSQQAEIQFKQSVVQAVGEVSDVLVQIDKLKEQRSVGEAMVKRSNEAVKNAEMLFKYNEATYLEMLVAQTNKLQAELDLANIKTQQLNATTSLYRSLGGGWQ
ncbi:efflux transporter outer membrane subunit [Elizabethkingia meningoseptica]|uniref:efflux transporter outer membrane subunit n=1 Tax=Elizabethkingia meningoseptica TaxID=238 RepID=UPI00301B4185